MRKPSHDPRRSAAAFVAACALLASTGCAIGVTQSQDAGEGDEDRGIDSGDESSDTGSGDGGAVVADGGNGDAGTPDAGGDAGLEDGGPCADYAAQVGRLLSAAQSCAHTSDCTIIETPCGLPGVCGAYVNAETAREIQPYEAGWTAGQCDVGQPCPGCAAPSMPAVCSGGVCAQGPGAGEACSQESDCPVPVFGGHLPRCLTDGGFTGGYCVQECAHGWGCDVPDARCRALPGNPAEQGYCFLVCSTDSDCRVGEGYRCCPSWGGFGEQGSVCYPGPCPS